MTDKVLLKTENQIYADIVGFIKGAITALNTSYPELKLTEWQVLQLNQPIKLTEITPTIYVSATTKRRRGWQYRTYPKTTEDLTLKERFKLEVDVQFSALKRRKLADTTTTLNSSDVLEYLRAYILNPNVLKTLRALGYLIYQPSEIQKPDFFDDSDNFEFMPFFSVTFILDQTLISPQNVINSITYTVEGV